MMTQNQPKLLVVDDMPINVSLMEEMVKNEYQIFSAYNGADAIKIASNNKPDLILLDIIMPEMDGYEVCQTIKNNSLTKDIPIIFITAKDHIEDESFGLKMGAIDYITKPFNLSIVKQRIQNHISCQEHQKALQEVIECKQKQLIHCEKLSSMGTLMAGITHEVNNTMTYVLGNLRMIKKYNNKFSSFYSSTEKLIGNLDHHTDVNDIENSLQEFKELNESELKSGKVLAYSQESINDCIEGMDRITSILKNLKLFSHQDDETSQTPELCDINSCIDMSVKLVANELKYKSELVRDYSNNLPQINACELQLSQVFVNLLINACHAINKQGIISISTDFKDNNVIIQVSDNGCGIPEEMQERIFEPFFTTKSREIGSGLGLSISHDIIKMYQGNITINSIVGTGTTFTISFPIEKANID
ncbi:MAG: response regulator [Methylococcales bacterium]|jgi:signal transduction histidine kinase|nr:response regulator [Methylococcales bacterium]MBT7409225.1 response regulator [Methylococcales bacterium]